MSAHISLHNTATVKAVSSGRISWLYVACADGTYVAIHMPFHVAERMAAAFNADRTNEVPA